MLRGRENLLSVSGGGTGRNNPASNSVLIGEGGAPINALANGSNGQIFTAGGTADPSWTSPNWQYVQGSVFNLSASSEVHIAIGGSLTPTGSGVVLVMVCGEWETSLGITLTMKLRHGTGTAPVSGAAGTGTLVTGSGTASLINFGATVPITPFAISAIISGLSLNVAHWFDITITPSGSANFLSINAPQTSIFELK